MIKAVLQRGNRRLLILGLSEQNLKALRRGRPIFFVGEEIGIDGVDFVIDGGKNEAALKRRLETLAPIDPNAIVGSICEACGSGRRQDGSCDCPETVQ